MVGGENIVIPLRHGWGGDVMREFLVLVHHEWPRAIVEELNEPIAVTLTDLHEDFREGLIFRDEESLIDRFKFGETIYNTDSLIYVVWKSRSIKIVVGCRESEIGKKLCLFANVWSESIRTG